MKKQIKEISVLALYDTRGLIEGLVSYDEKLRTPVFYTAGQATVAEIKSLLSKICDVGEDDVATMTAGGSVDPNGMGSASLKGVDNRIPPDSKVAIGWHGPGGGGGAGGWKPMQEVISEK